MHENSTNYRILNPQQSSIESSSPGNSTSLILGAAIGSIAGIGLIGNFLEFSHSSSNHCHYHHQEKEESRKNDT